MAEQIRLNPNGQAEVVPAADAPARYVMMSNNSLRGDFDWGITFCRDCDNYVALKDLQKHENDHHNDEEVPC